MIRRHFQKVAVADCFAEVVGADEDVTPAHTASSDRRSLRTPRRHQGNTLLHMGLDSILWASVALFLFVWGTNVSAHDSDRPPHADLEVSHDRGTPNMLPKYYNPHYRTPPTRAPLFSESPPNLASARFFAAAGVHRFDVVQLMRPRMWLSATYRGSRCGGVALLRGTDFGVPKF